GGVQPGAVVVDGGRAVDDLVAAVAVDVGDRELMVALPGVPFVPLVIGVEDPALVQLFAVEVHGAQHRARVVAAGDQGAGVLAVEIGGRRQEAVHAVAVVVAPVGDLTPFGHVVDRVDRFARGAFEHGQVFRAVQHVPLVV